MVRLRRPSLRELAGEYLKLKSEADAFKAAFEGIPRSETSTRVRTAKEMLYKRGKAIEAIVRMVERFSPKAAKELSFKLKNHMKVVKDRFQTYYDSSPKFRNMPESMKKDIINSQIDISIDFSDINEQFASIVFVAVNEAMERTAGKPPVELDEYLKERLHSLNPKYAEFYEGSWEALESERHDRFSHCAVSNRRLIHGLVGEKGLARRAKLKSISKSSVEARLVESLADTVDRLNEVLSKGVHKEIEYETALLSLRITEHLLRFILAHT